MHCSGTYEYLVDSAGNMWSVLSMIMKFARRIVDGIRFSKIQTMRFSSCSFTDSNACWNWCLEGTSGKCKRLEAFSHSIATHKHLDPVRSRFLRIAQYLQLTFGHGQVGSTGQGLGRDFFLIGHRISGQHLSWTCMEIVSWEIILEYLAANSSSWYFNEIQFNSFRNVSPTSVSAITSSYGRLPASASASRNCLASLSTDLRVQPPPPRRQQQQQWPYFNFNRQVQKL